MSFFPQAFLSSHPAQSSNGFTPLFRLLEDFDTYNRNSPSANEQQRHTSLKTFTPKFDVKEVEGAYELHGELPGIEQKDVEIEFTDAQTISVRGKIEREYHTSSEDTKAVEGSNVSGALESAPSETQADKSHRATVADENEESTSATQDQSVQKATPSGTPQQQQKKPAARYWATERTFGSFARTFTFPERVDQDAVKASIKNGVLSVIVPKAPKYQSKKKITVE